MASEVDIAVAHPHFKHCLPCVGDGYHVCVFEKDTWNEPTQEQIADYRRRERIVYENGGAMRIGAYQIAGLAPTFTDEECEAMRHAVREVRGYAIVKEWNGAGHYTFSIAIQEVSREQG